MDLVKVMDVSSYQSVEGLPGLIDYYEPDHVIVRLYQDDELPGLRDLSKRHIETVLSKGKTLGGYGWLYGFGNPPDDQVNSMLSLLEEIGGQDIPRLWLDIEEYYSKGVLTFPTLSQTLKACEFAEQAWAQPTGIYTRDSFIRDKWKVPGIGELSWRVAWLADYDPNGQNLMTSAYWPVEMVKGRQWQGSPIDLSVMDKTVTVLTVEDPPALDTGPTLEDLQNLIGYLSGDVANDMEGTLFALWAKLSPTQKTKVQTQHDHLADLIRVLQQGAN